MLLFVDDARSHEISSLPQALQYWPEQWRREQNWRYTAEMIQQESSSKEPETADRLAGSLSMVSTQHGWGDFGSRSSGERNSSDLLTPVSTVPSTVKDDLRNSSRQEQQPSPTRSRDELDRVMRMATGARARRAKAEDEEAEARKEMNEARQKMEEAENKIQQAGLEAKKADEEEITALKRVTELALARIGLMEERVNQKKEQDSGC
ncbi:Putative protein of unknown function [Podospora comata]|uniref:Uncharacterized protein n=1 Tax=Podospora comata TaxID=48703 RepID=A0ABY6RUZ8_PODCO|nr:Putative protein of unknown function [Podospora comata]